MYSTQSSSAHTHLTSCAPGSSSFCAAIHPTLFLVNTANCEASGDRTVFAAMSAGSQQGRIRTELQEPSHHVLSKPLGRNTPCQYPGPFWGLTTQCSLPRMTRFLKPRGKAT